MRRQAWHHVVCANSAATGVQKHVLTIMAHHANNRGYVGLPIPTIAELCGLSEMTVRSSLIALVKAGELYPYWRRTGRGQFNIYQITVSTAKAIDTKALKVKIIPLPKPVDFAPLRVLEEPA